MLDYSTWGDAWGFSWGDAWGCVEAVQQRPVGGDDAPLRPIDEEWVREPWRFGDKRAEVYEAAVEAVGTAKSKPTAKNITNAAIAVERITDPYAGPLQIRPKAKKPDLEGLRRATEQLAAVEAAYEAYKVAKRQEEEAVIALLMAI